MSRQETLLLVQPRRQKTGTKSPVKSGALFCSVAHLAKENSVKSEKKADKEDASVSTHFFLIAQLIQLYGVLLY